VEDEVVGVGLPVLGIALPDELAYVKGWEAKMRARPSFPMVPA